MASARVKHSVKDVLMQNTTMETIIEGADPPFEEAYKNLFTKHNLNPLNNNNNNNNDNNHIIEELELPLINLGRLESVEEAERDACKLEIVEASKSWGFFMVINHGISRHILDAMIKEQIKVFKEPFWKKNGDNCMNLKLSSGSYRWGSPSAKGLNHLSWSEAFHIALNDISNANTIGDGVFVNNLRSTVQQYATNVSKLANNLANILAEKLGYDGEEKYFEKNCSSSSCYLRMNRYLPCPKYANVYGLMPHTDSAFLTILYQDQVGGLHFIKDGKWVSVKPNPESLIVNIGDLFQVWSNGVYKSVVHRVVANPKLERYSTAYFLCPSGDTIIESHKKPSFYKKFSFKEYRQQVQEDVRLYGHKIGLSRFLICK